MTIPPSDVSAIIPVIGSGEYILEAIESVAAQTIPAREVIVVGKIERASEIEHRFGGLVRVVEPKSTRVWGACNLGVTFARGDILAFLGSNDRWKPTKLELQLGVFRAKPAADIALGHSAWIDPNGNLEELGLVAGTMIVHRQPFLRNGFFRDEVDPGVFSAWLSGARDRGLTVEIVPEVVLEKRTFTLETSPPPPGDIAPTESISTRKGD